MPWLNKRWISFFIISAVVGVVFISLVGWGNNQEGNKVRNKFDSFGADSDLNPSYTSSQVLLTLVQANSFDPNGKAGPTFGAKLAFQPFSNLTSPIQIQATLLNPLNLTNAGLLPQTINVDAVGNPNTYPFDSYEAQIQIVASSNGTDIPLTVFVEGSLQGFIYTTDFNGSIDGSTDGSDVLITFEVRRNTTTRLFAAIIFLLMWFLSLSIFIAAMSVWFRGKNTELPLVAISTALLFALPNIRNSQPGVPSPVGTTEDMVGFFWNILLVAISAISLLIKWILQNKRPTPVLPTDQEKKPGQERVV